LVLRVIRPEAGEEPAGFFDLAFLQKFSGGEEFPRVSSTRVFHKIRVEKKSKNPDGFFSFSRF